MSSSPHCRESGASQALPRLVPELDAEWGGVNLVEAGLFRGKAGFYHLNTGKIGSWLSAPSSLSSPFDYS